MEGRTLHLHDRDITTRGPITYAPTPEAAAPYGTGAVLELWDRDPLMVWYDATGNVIRRRLFSQGLTWSPMHHEVAWSGSRGVVIVASSTTGRILHRYPAPRQARRAPAAGWVGPGDLLFAAGFAVPRGWRTSSGAVTDEPASPVAVSDRLGLVAGVLGRTRGSDVLCLAAWSLDRPTPPLWNGCLERGGRTYSGTGASFSPDGHLLAALATHIGRGESRPFIAVTDTRTGAVTARLDQGRDDGGFRGPEYAVHTMRWEDDTHLLLVVDDRTLAIIGRYGDIQPLEALVRCDVTTLTCELATAPRRTALMATAAYGLVG